MSMKTERIVPAMIIGESAAEPGGKFARGTLASYAVKLCNVCPEEVVIIEGLVIETVKEGFVKVTPGAKVSFIVPSGMTSEVYCRPLFTRPLCRKRVGLRFRLKKSEGFPLMVVFWLKVR